MRRSTIYFIAGAFLLFITAPLALHLLGRGETESVENRSVAAPPPPTPQDLVDADYYGTVTQYIKDTFPFRSEAVAADAEVDLLVGDSPNLSVTLGNDGWLFYAPTLQAPCFAEPHATKAVDQIRLMYRVAVATGRSFAFMIVPDKASIYPEYVRDGSDNGCRETNRDLLLEALAEGEPMPFVITLWSAIETAKPENRRYFLTDTHWNDFGAQIGAEYLIETLQPGLWEREHVIPSGSSSTKRDLMSLIGLEHPEETEVLRVERPGVEVTRASTGEGKQEVTSSEAGGPADMIEQPTAIIRDSFFSPVQPMVAPYFSDVRSVEWFNLETDPARELLQTSEVIVVETAERHFYNRILAGLGDRLVVALIDELDATVLARSGKTPSSLTITSEEPTTGTHLVVVGEPLDGDIHIAVDGNGTSTRSFSDGFVVIPLGADPFLSATVTSDGSASIADAWIVRIPPS